MLVEFVMNVKRVELLRVTSLAFYPEDNIIIAIGMNDSTIQIYSVWVDELYICLSGILMDGRRRNQEAYSHHLAIHPHWLEKLKFHSTMIDQHYVLVVHESQIATIYDNQYWIA